MRNRKSTKEKEQKKKNMKKNSIKKKKKSKDNLLILGYLMILLQLHELYTIKWYDDYE
jgi:cytoskeletal protein RodZ